MSPRRLALAACTLVVGLPGVALSASPLEPYRTLQRSAAAPKLLAIARGAITAYFDQRAALRGVDEPDWPGPPIGVFVSLVSDSRTRACVGSAEPVGGSLAETVRALAVQALHADRRHPPVGRVEMAELRIAISFSGLATPVADPMLIDPAREGLLVSTDRGSVAFLPGEARTVSWALREARRAGVMRGDPSATRFERFDVVVLVESPLPFRPNAALRRKA